MDDLVQMRQAVAQAIATKNTSESRRTKPSPQQTNGIVAPNLLQQTNEPLARSIDKAILPGNSDGDNSWSSKTP